MPWTFSQKYVCPVCGASFLSTHYKRPDRCPDCRKARRRERILANYYQRRAEGRDPSQKKRDRAYDGNRLGAPESVYASLSVIHLRYEVAACRSCRKVTNIINGFCSLCRGNGANEQQCTDPREIK